MKNLVESPAWYWLDCGYPSPCDYYGDLQKPCTCAHSTVTKCQKRISGPMLDRIDIHTSP